MKESWSRAEFVLFASAIARLWKNSKSKAPGDWQHYNYTQCSAVWYVLSPSQLKNVTTGANRAFSYPGKMKLQPAATRLKSGERTKTRSINSVDYINARLALKMS